MDPTLPAPEIEPPKRKLVRSWFLAMTLGMAALVVWLAWPSGPEPSPFDLSRADGKPRFWATAYPREQLPSTVPLSQRLFWKWWRLKRRYKPIPAAYRFPAEPVRPCSIDGLLNQCMEVSGTRYFVAVEIAGAVDFGHTNALNGVQWVAAFERAIETSGPVTCYDYGKKRNFQDTLLLIRERPTLVKIVPRSKLADYQKAGLVKASSR